MSVETLDWVSTRATQSFPLADNVSGMSTQGIQLPDQFLLDMKINIPYTTEQSQLDSSKFHIKQVRQHGNLLSVIVGYDGTECLIASGIPKNITIASTMAARFFILSPLVADSSSQLSKLSGSISVGVTTNFAFGLLSFTLQTAQINPFCVSFININPGEIEPDLKSVTINGRTYTQDLTVVLGQGLVVTQGAQNTVNIDISDQYLKQLVRAYIAQNYGDPIKTINGVSPNSVGNFRLIGADCVDVKTVQGVITISNPCSKPCCTSQNTQALAASLQVIKKQQDVLTEYYVNMTNNINYMQSNLATLLST